MSLFPKFMTTAPAKPAKAANAADGANSQVSGLAALAGGSVAELNQMEGEYYRLLQQFKAFHWADGNDVPVETKLAVYPEISNLLSQVSCLYSELHGKGRQVSAKVPGYLKFDRNLWGAQYGLLVSLGECLFHQLGGFRAVRRSSPEMLAAEKEIDRAFYAASPKAGDVSAALHKWKSIMFRLHKELTAAVETSQAPERNGTGKHANRHS